MNTCRCEEYEEIVKNFKVFTFGTIHHLKPRMILPGNRCMKWVCNKTNSDDLRFNKLVIVNRAAFDEDTAVGKQKERSIESKWIPVLPGLISQRLVNERKNENLKSPY